MKKFPIRFIFAATAAAFAGSASAHTGLLPAYGFHDGWAHPFLGLDHLLVMLGVGLWASTQTRRCAGQALEVFLAFMAGGALLGLSGLAFAYVESGIFISLLAVGLVLASGKTELPKLFSFALIAASATLHGLAHGNEMPAAASAYAYITGMVAATGILHLAGLSLGLLSQHFNAGVLLRVYGSLTGMAGAWLLLAA